MGVPLSLGYQDVFAFPDGRLGYARDSDGPAVTLTIDGVPAWRLPTPEPLLYVRAAWLGAVVVIGQGNASGNALVSVDGGVVASVGPSFGQNAVAVGPDGLYVVRSASRIDVLSVSGIFIRQIAAFVGSQGIRDVMPNGELRIADQWQARVRNGVTLVQPCERGAVMVGQTDPPQIAGGGPIGAFTAQMGLGFEPHVCELPSGRYAVCARPWNQPVLLPPYPPFQSGDQPVPPALKKPEVSTDAGKWTLQHLRNGEFWEFYDRENPELGYRVRVFVENGGIRAQISNAAGSGVTGAFRQVFPS